MVQYLIDQDREKRDRLSKVTREKLNELIDREMNDPEHVVESEEISALGYLITNNKLELFPVEWPGKEHYCFAIRLLGDHGNRATLVFYPPPMSDLFLQSTTSEEVEHIDAICVESLMKLINDAIAELDASIARGEAELAKGAPQRRLEQREKVDKLRQRLAEVRALSYMGRMELSRATMILMTNLEHEIHEEIEKSTKKN